MHIRMPVAKFAYRYTHIQKHSLVAIPTIFLSSYLCFTYIHIYTNTHTNIHERTHTLTTLTLAHFSSLSVYEREYVSILLYKYSCKYVDSYIFTHINVDDF